MMNDCKQGNCDDIHSFFERLNYYFGKMMTVRDFKDEQKYLNEKRWLLNRFGIGWGVLRGLKVLPHTEKNVTHIIIERGLAIDKYGHEIFLSDCQEINLAKMIEDYHPQMVDVSGSPPMESPPSPYYYVYLQYKECFAEPSPLPIDECESSETDCAYNRIREMHNVIISQDEPDLQNPFDLDLKDLMECQIDILENPCAYIIANCPDRKPCIPVPLARIEYIKDRPIDLEHIDNCNYRKLAYSNELLYQLIERIHQEFWRLHAARYSRKQHIPILAQTIPGLKYKDGKILSLTSEAGVQPIRMSSDGTHLWLTDQHFDDTVSPSASNIIRVKSDGCVNYDPDIKLNQRCWGIALADKTMWITHPDSEEPGSLTCINICNVNEKETIEIEGLPKFPQEIVYDNKYLWISHGSGTGGGNLNFVLSQVDPVTKSYCPPPSPSLVLPTWCIPVAPVKAMVFDGEAIWITFKAKAYGSIKAVAARIVNGQCMGNPCTLEGKEPEDIVFDGTYVWVSHDMGISKIRIQPEIQPGDEKESYRVKEESSTRNQTALTFDGRYLWSGEQAKQEVRINRIDILTAEITEGEEIKYDGDDYIMSKLWFDGSFIWVAASQQLPDLEHRTGIIHRLLP